MQSNDETVLWIGAEPVDVLEAAGEDRVRFLNGLLTCDVKALAPGSGAYGFFTTQQGKIIADAIVLVRQDSIWLELPAGGATEVIGHLEKYKIADRVTLTPLEGHVAVRTAGAAVETAIARVGLPIPPTPTWSHVSAKWRGAEAVVLRHGRVGGPAVAVYLPSPQAGALFAELPSAGAASGVGVIEEMRIRSGFGRFGVDFDRRHFPQEAGAEEAVSYTKGCYLGQEVVARIHYRGGVNHALRGLRFEAGQAPAAGTALLVEGREVGKVTSVAPARLGSDAVGLAVVHKRGWDMGQRLELEGGGAAIVTEAGG